MKTLRVKVTGKKTGQVGEFEFTPDTFPDGRWRQVRGTLRLVGQKGVVDRGIAELARGSFTWGGGSAQDGGALMEFMGVDSDAYTEGKCGVLKGDGVIFMPWSGKGARPTVGKEPISWEIQLDPCGVS